jgi:creatinine amidohydrolase
MNDYMFDHKTRGEITTAQEQGAILLLPFGQTEQHGPHLPEGCDTFIAQRTALAAAQACNGNPQVLVLPAIPYGYNPKSNQKWPSFRVRWEITAGFLADVCTSAVEMGFSKLIIVSTHGPHGDIAKIAAREVFDRTGVGIVVSMPHTLGASAFKKIRKSPIGGSSHAGEYETSLMLHFGFHIDVQKLDARDMVHHCDEWVAGDFVNGSGKVSWSTWALQLSETGVYGDASVATAQTGEQVFNAIVDEYVRLIRYVRDTDLPKQVFPLYPRSW